MAGKAKQQNRLLAGMPDISEFASIPGAPNQRIAAMISIIARHPSVAPQGTFKLAGGSITAGVYRLKVGASKAKRSTKAMAKAASAGPMNAMWRPKIERVQSFKKDITNKKLDWAHLALARVHAQADSIMAKAFAKTFKK